MRNVKKESDLYPGMVAWLRKHLEDKYPSDTIIVSDTSTRKLEDVLRENGIDEPKSVGVNIQIDVLGIVKQQEKHHLIFIEAKKTALSLQDLGQLWAYCRLIEPSEAYLLSSKGFGSLSKVLNILGRKDMLDYGVTSKMMRMKVGIWKVEQNRPDFLSMIS